MIPYHKPETKYISIIVTYRNYLTQFIYKTGKPGFYFVQYRGW